MIWYKIKWYTLCKIEQDRTTWEHDTEQHIIYHTLYYDTIFEAIYHNRIQYAKIWCDITFAVRTHTYIDKMKKWIDIEIDRWIIK